MKPTYVVSLAFAAFVSLLAPEARAAEGHEGGGLGLLALQILNVAILLGVLIYFTRKPIAEFMAARARSIADGIGRAEDQRRRAAEDLEQWKARVSRAEDEAREILDRLVEHSEQEAARLLERAEGMADRVREEARAIADQEVARARQQLRAEAADLAIELAAELVREQLSDDDQGRLVAEYTRDVGDVGSAASSDGGPGGGRS